MPSVKLPCLQCKEKHVKCDEQRPKCQRCVQKHLPCDRPSKKTVFRHDSSAGKFSQDQEWVNSEPRQFRFHMAGASPADSDSPDFSVVSWTSEKPCEPRRTSGEGDTSDDTSSPFPSEARSSSRDHQTAPRNKNRLSVSSSAAGSGAVSDGNRAYPTNSLPEQSLAYLPSSHPPTAFSTGSSIESYAQSIPSTQLPGLSANSPLSPSGVYPTFPLQDVQEACLLHYFVQEISKWFDLCDVNRHFQFVIPVVAGRHPHLLNAIFAVSARHLCRLPQHRTPQGIVYHGQLLPHLSQHVAVEYMLKCIPAFRQFHDVQDDDFRDSIIATAVILRQMEEIDDDEDDAMEGGPLDNHTGGKRVNFLAIINAVLQDEALQALLGRRSIIQAAYWMALRQEIYHSFTRREPPQLILAPEYWQTASKVNKTVMHTVQVAKWHWGGGSDEEWLRLMDQQVHLETQILSDYRPIFRKPADKATGEIFPTIWYASHIEVTAIQQAIMARSILVAENPLLRTHQTSRGNWRRVENEVRLLLLDLCGIALCNPDSTPALVNAAIGIELYGDFFTDHYERIALRTVAQRYADARAWPVKNLLRMFE